MSEQPLRKAQLAAIEGLKRADQQQRAGFLVAHAMGLGKARTAIEFLKSRAKVESKHSTLIVAPANVCHKWLHDEMARWWPSQVNVLYPKTGPQVKIASQLISDLGGVCIISWALLASVRGTFDVVVLDESHFLASDKSIRTRETRRIVEASEDTFCILLSGTPEPQETKDLFPQLNLIAPDLFPDYWQFMRRFAVQSPSLYTPSGFTWGGLNKDCAGELYGMLDRIAHRSMDRSELPPHTILAEFIPAKSSSQLEAVNHDGEVAAEVSMEVNQDATVDMTVDLIGQAIRAGERQFVVGAWLKTTAKKVLAAATAKGWFVSYIDGEQSQDVRRQHIDAVANSEGIAVLVGTIASMQVGIDLVWADRSIMAELPFRTSDADQFLGRFVRLSSTKPHTTHIIVPENTRWEESARRFIKRKEDIMRVMGSSELGDATIAALNSTQDSDEDILRKLVFEG